MSKKYKKLLKEEVSKDLNDYLKKEWKGTNLVSNDSLNGFKNLINELIDYSTDKSSFWFYDRILDETFNLWNNKRIEYKYTNSLATIKKINNIKEIYHKLSEIYEIEKNNWEEELFIHSVINSTKERYKLEVLKPMGWESFTNKYKNISEIKDIVLNNDKLTYFGGLDLPLKPPFQKHVSLEYTVYQNITNNKEPFNVLFEGIIYYSMTANKIKNSTDFIKIIKNIDNQFENLSATEINRSFDFIFDYKYKRLKIEEEKQKNELKNILNKFIQK